MVIKIVRIKYLKVIELLIASISQIAGVGCIHTANMSLQNKKFKYYAVFLKISLTFRHLMNLTNKINNNPQRW